jgi:hypothetical protein
MARRVQWVESASRPRQVVLPFYATLLALFTFVTSSVFARVSLVTLPGRDSVQLTIYNSVDLTLVKETRVLTFRKGLNRLEFSWANTLIDPTSVEFQALTHADAVEVLDVSFPPRVGNTLEWRIQSEFAGEVQVEIRYFTSGISWSADYVAEAEKTEKAMALAGNVRVNNKSGEDYENAQVRLIVGVVRLVEQIAQLARQSEAREKAGKPMTEMLRDKKERQDLYFAFADADLSVNMSGFGAVSNRPREVTKEALSEYFLYTVEGRDTIPNGWAKRLPSFSVAAGPIPSYYKFEKERWADRVTRFYRFTNSVGSRLGKEPLPDGAVKAFRVVSDDHLYAFVGRTPVKYIPINDEVELDLGADQEVLVKPTLVNWVKSDLAFDNNGNVKGWTLKETWEIEMQNSKDIDVVVDVRRNFSGDWSMTTEAKHEKVDADKVKFVIPLRSREKQRFRYELTTRHGTNATK